MRPTFNEEKERAEQRGNEWQFGAITTDLAAVPLHDRLLYAPVGVLQRNSIMDTNGCASRAPVAVLNTKFSYFYDRSMHPELRTWLEQNGYVKNGKVVFDETFIEILSNTTPTGNSLKAPLEAIRKYGLIPEMLPLEEGMTWEQYMDKKRITPAMYELGKQFAARFTINYEQLPSSRFSEALQEDPLDVAANAWPEPQNGVYPRTEAPFNHAFATLTPDIYAHDSYPPHTKLLARDYFFFDWGYSLSVTSQNPNDKEHTLRQYLQLAIAVLTGILAACRAGADYCRALILPAVPPATPPIQPVEPPKPLTPIPDRKTPSQSLYEVAYGFIGKDASPADRASDDVACAESLEAIYHAAFGEYIAQQTLSTRTLYMKMRNHFDFMEVDEPAAGDIAIWPTEGPRIGHCGIVGKRKALDGTLYVMSNDSRTGTWEVNYTSLSAKESARSRGLKLYFFRRV